MHSCKFYTVNILIFFKVSYDFNTKIYIFSIKDCFGAKNVVNCTLKNFVVIPEKSVKMEPKLSFNKAYIQNDES